jgi:hypothetical protein
MRSDVYEPATFLYLRFGGFADLQVVARTPRLYHVLGVNDRTL